MPLLIPLAGLLWTALAAIVVWLLTKVLGRLIAVAAAAIVFSKFPVGRALVEAMEFLLPTKDETTDLSAYLEMLNYAQGWFDVAFFLQLLVAYWTFAAALGMTKVLLAFLGMK